MRQAGLFLCCGLMRIAAAVFCLSLLGSAIFGGPGEAAVPLEARKLPMKFTWHAADVCAQDCQAWISAVGVITSNTMKVFDDFARKHDLKGTTVVLDSSGGSVLDAIALGRRWRDLGLHTAVGIVTERPAPAGLERSITPKASCESMCVFLLLAGTSRTVPDGAHVRVHQIWMGDRADNAKAANYSAQDLMTIQRDVGQLAQYTIDMGGSGELLSLALSVPPWEPLYELTPSELRLTNILSPDAVASIAAPASKAMDNAKPIQERVVSSADILENKSPASDLMTTQATETQLPVGSATTPVERK